MNWHCLECIWFDNKLFHSLVALSRYDLRLSYLNLKNHSTRGNIIGQKERDEIWIPNLVFTNSIDDSFVTNDEMSSLEILLKGMPKVRIPLIFFKFYSTKPRVLISGTLPSLDRVASIFIYLTPMPRPGIELTSILSVSWLHRSTNWATALRQSP